MKHFYSFLALFFNSIFNFFELKRPSTSARSVVPLTTPLSKADKSAARNQQLKRGKMKKD